MPQFEGQAPNTTRKVKSRGFAVGWDAVLSSSMVNTFRYGLTTIKEDIVGLQAVIAGELPQHRQLRRAHRHAAPATSRRTASSTTWRG